MKKTIAVVLIVSAAAVLLAGCAGGMPESELSFAGPIVDNMLTGIAQKDYTIFSRDFSDELKSALPESSFAELTALFEEKIGDYESREFGQSEKKIENDREYTVIVYKAKYSKETGYVIITVAFSEYEGVMKLEGILFNSENLRQ